MTDDNIYKKVRDLLKNEQADEAKKLFQKIEEGETAEYYLLKGAIAQKFQNWGDAINAYTKVQEIDPESEEAKNNLKLIQNILNFWNPDMFNP